MSDATLKISAMPAVARLADDMKLAALRPGAPRNVQLEAGALQGRLWRPEILALTGGGADALDSLPTVGLVRERVDLYVGGELQFWILLAGTAETNAAAGIVRPVDYEEGGNEKNWIRVL
jgi:hypothetical protein